MTAPVAVRSRLCAFAAEGRATSVASAAAISILFIMASSVNMIVALQRAKIAAVPRM
jgi:hypothetical protein